MISIELVYDMNEIADIDDDWLNTTCKNILKDNNHDTATIIIILSDDTKLLQLKKKYFQQELLTDVITFNLEEDGDPVEGEIYISLNRVSENARKFRQDVEKELKRVIIHGLLHLLGYDDQTPKEKKLMTNLEEHYLSQPVVSDQI